MTSNAVQDIKTMDRAAIEQEILSFIQKEIQNKDIVLTMETPTDAVVIDSIDMIHVLFQIEERFGCEIDAPKTMTPKTVGDIVNALIEAIEASR